jgi:hypothetical protein
MKLGCTTPVHYTLLYPMNWPGPLAGLESQLVARTTPLEATEVVKLSKATRNIAKSPEGDKFMRKILEADKFLGGSSSNVPSQLHLSEG